MKTIHKYPVPIADEIDVQMPRGAEPLSVQFQRGELMMWALVETENPSTLHRFGWRGTGHPCDGLLAQRHVGTVQMHGGQLVFHLFDMGEP